MVNESIVGLQPLVDAQERSNRSKSKVLKVFGKPYESTMKGNIQGCDSKGGMPSAAYGSLDSMPGCCTPSRKSVETWIRRHAMKVRKLYKKDAAEKKKQIQQKIAIEPEKGPFSDGGCVASSEMRNKAYKICRQFLSGSWKSISSNDMIFKTVTGGLSNLLYYCSLPETHTPLCGEPAQVLMRMYGQIHDDQGSSTVTESIICTLLSERALGPKLFGVFPGGRLEEYIPARALRNDQIQVPDISLSIARKMARLHALQAPLTKEPTWIRDNYAKWIKAGKQIDISTVPDEQIPMAKMLLEFDFEAEFTWLREVIKSAQSPVMFCHNDLQEGNILHMGDADNRDATPDENLCFIDFEYCAYNYRGFDIANHFCEWLYDYNHPEFPFYLENTECYPTEEAKRAFIGEYLKTLETTSIYGDIDPKVNTVEHLLQEVEIFTLVCHILWSTWSLNSAYTSKITFGYWEFGACRLSRYLELKANMKDRLDFAKK